MRKSSRYHVTSFSFWRIQFQEVASAFDNLNFHVVLHHVTKNELAVNGTKVVRDDGVPPVHVLVEPAAKFLHYVRRHRLTVLWKSELGSVTVLGNDRVWNETICWMLPSLNVEENVLGALCNFLQSR